MSLQLTRVTNSTTESPSMLKEFLQFMVSQINGAGISKRRLIRVDNVTSATPIRLQNPGFVVGGLLVAQIRRIDAAHVSMTCFPNWIQGQDGVIRVDLEGLTLNAKYNVTFEVIENG